MAEPAPSFAGVGTPPRWHTEPYDEDVDRPPTLDVDEDYAGCDAHAETPDEALEDVTVDGDPVDPHDDPAFDQVDDGEGDGADG